MLLNNIDEELTDVRKTERDTETYKFGVFLLAVTRMAKPLGVCFLSAFAA